MAEGVFGGTQNMSRSGASTNNGMDSAGTNAANNLNDVVSQLAGIASSLEKLTKSSSAVNSSEIELNLSKIQRSQDDSIRSFLDLQERRWREEEKERREFQQNMSKGFDGALKGISELGTKPLGFLEDALVGGARKLWNGAAETIAGVPKKKTAEEAEKIRQRYQNAMGSWVDSINNTIKKQFKDNVDTSTTNNDAVVDAINDLKDSLDGGQTNVTSILTSQDVIDAINNIPQEFQDYFDQQFEDLGNKLEDEFQSVIDAIVDGKGGVKLSDGTLYNPAETIPLSEPSLKDGDFETSPELTLDMFGTFQNSIMDEGPISELETSNKENLVELLARQIDGTENNFSLQAEQLNGIFDAVIEGDKEIVDVSKENEKDNEKKMTTIGSDVVKAVENLKVGSVPEETEKVKKSDKKSAGKKKDDNKEEGGKDLIAAGTRALSGLGSRDMAGAAKDLSKATKDIEKIATGGSIAKVKGALGLAKIAKDLAPQKKQSEGGVKEDKTKGFLNKILSAFSKLGAGLKKIVSAVKSSGAIKAILAMIVIIILPPLINTISTVIAKIRNFSAKISSQLKSFYLKEKAAVLKFIAGVKWPNGKPIFGGDTATENAKEAERKSIAYEETMKVRAEAEANGDDLAYVRKLSQEEQVKAYQNSLSRLSGENNEIIETNRARNKEIAEREHEIHINEKNFTQEDVERAKQGLIAAGKKVPSKDKDIIKEFNKLGKNEFNALEKEAKKNNNENNREFQNARNYKNSDDYAEQQRKLAKDIAEGSSTIDVQNAQQAFDTLAKDTGWSSAQKISDNLNAAQEVQAQKLREEVLPPQVLLPEQTLGVEDNSVRVRNNSSKRVRNATNTNSNESSVGTEYVTQTANSQKSSKNSSQNSSNASNQTVIQNNSQYAVPSYPSGSGK